MGKLRYLRGQIQISMGTHQFDAFMYKYWEKKQKHEIFLILAVCTTYNGSGVGFCRFCPIKSAFGHFKSVSTSKKIVLITSSCSTNLWRLQGEYELTDVLLCQYMGLFMGPGGAKNCLKCPDIRLFGQLRGILLQKSYI